jgi:hypothetical protein
MIPIENSISLFRDEKTNAIVNCSNFEYENYLKEKQRKLQEIEKSKKIEDEIGDMKKEINEIKFLLNTLVMAIDK